MSGFANHFAFAPEDEDPLQTMRQVEIQEPPQIVAAPEEPTPAAFGAGAPAPMPQPAPLPSGNVDAATASDIKRRTALLNMLQVFGQGAANSANIFRPGAGNPQAVAQFGDQMRAQVAAPVADARQQRVTAIQDQQLGAQQADAAAKRKQAYDLVDPRSEMSAAAREQAKQMLATRAQMIGKHRPELAAQFAGLAASLEGKSAAQIQRIMEGSSGLMGEGLKLTGTEMNAEAVSGRQGIAQQQADTQSKRTDAQISQDWAELQERKRHNQASEAHDSAAPTVKIRMEAQEKLNHEISNLDETVRMLENVQQLKTGGRVDTGPIAAKVNKVKQMMGIEDPNYDNLEQQLATVNNKIVKDFAGSAVSPSEWSRISQQIATTDKNDPQFESNIKNAIQQAKSLKKKRTEEYQRGGGGAPLDQSVTAKNAHAATSPPASAPTPAPHGETVKQNGKTFKWNGSKYVEVK